MPDGLRMWLREHAFLEVTEAVADAMNRSRVFDHDALARRLGWSKRRFNRFLDGDENMRVADVADVLGALGRELVVTSRKRLGPKR